MSIITLFRILEDKHDVNRVKNCSKHFCESLREQSIKIMNFKKKKKLLTKEQHESHKNAKICYICKENLKINT